MKSKKLRLICNFKRFNVNSNFIISAFNLAFIAYYFLGLIKPTSNFYLWCDGIVGKIHAKSKKIPGSKFITFFFNFKFSNITVMGNYSKKQNLFLKKKFKTKVNFIKLPKITKQNVNKFIPKIQKNSLILITLPTPKQEILANAIKKRSKYFKIVCIGGGLSIASGEIKKCPKLIQDIGLEFVWRLNSDPWRRIKRLVLTTIIYIINVNKVNKKIKIIKI